jgi:hypothetical protein
LPSIVGGEVWRAGQRRAPRFRSHLPGGLLTGAAWSATARARGGDRVPVARVWLSDSRGADCHTLRDADPPKRDTRAGYLRCQPRAELYPTALHSPAYRDIPRETRSCIAKCTRPVPGSLCHTRKVSLHSLSWAAFREIHTGNCAQPASLSSVCGVNMRETLGKMPWCHRWVTRW